MKNLETKLEELQRQLDEVKQQLSKPAFEVGKWYRDNVINSKFLIFKTNKNGTFNHDDFGYGFTVNGTWTNSLGMTGNEIPATNKQIVRALVEEARNRGHNGVFSFDALDNVLFADDKAVFCNGKWVDIIKQEPINIGGFEVIKVNYPDENTYKIGCKLFPKAFLIYLKATMEDCEFKTVSFDGHEVTPETIDKILKLC